MAQKPSTDWPRRTTPLVGNEDLLRQNPLGDSSDSTKEQRVPVDLISDYVLNQIDYSKAIESWKGPDRAYHDFEFKMRHAREFLSEGNKVKAMVQFRGRDIVYNEQGLELLKRFADALSDLGKVESPPKLEGKRMNMLLAPTK